MLFGTCYWYLYCHAVSFNYVYVSQFLVFQIIFLLDGGYIIVIVSIDVMILCSLASFLFITPLIVWFLDPVRCYLAFCTSFPPSFGSPKFDYPYLGYPPLLWRTTYYPQATLTGVPTAPQASSTHMSQLCCRVVLPTYADPVTEACTFHIRGRLMTLLRCYKFGGDFSTLLHGWLHFLSTTIDMIYDQLSLFLKPSNLTPYHVLFQIIPQVLIQVLTQLLTQVLTQVLIQVLTLVFTQFVTQALT